MSVSNLYAAHSRSQRGHEDPVRSHLQEVAKRAAEYAAAFGAADEAHCAGLLHDLGKYGDLFQRRLKDPKVHGVDHWSLGASVALGKYQREGIALALAIQGHHLGLQQASGDSLKRLLSPKLQESLPQNVRLSESDPQELLRRFEGDGLTLPTEPSESLYTGLSAPKAAAMLDVRMLFSALVDADFLETEAHFQAPDSTRKFKREAGPPLEADRALSVLRSYLESLAADSNASSHVNQLRTDLLKECWQAASSPQGLFTLTAPTGAGKTLSMLAFALKHAVAHNLRRIVVVIPYLSIIEQTVRAYREALAKLADADTLTRYVLEHHSLAGTREREEGQQARDDDVELQARLLTENWDAPIIVTTSVQFLQSLFANRPSACRKLHRLAQSVILFDEVQTLPTKLAVPTLATLSRLAERYQASIVFATATQPAFAHLDGTVRRYCTGGWQPREIVPEGLKLFERARRTKVAWPDEGSAATPWPEIAKQIANCEQVLCVVNLKRHAWRLLDLLEELRGRAGLVHLSTNMCPAHRQKVLYDVRQRLKEEEGQPCRLISTQCVEAGVDVDFPVVYRTWGPLDAIAQAAGRCNRNGQAPVRTVHIFLPEPEEGKRNYPDGGYKQATQVTRMLLKELGANQMDIHAPALFARYYRSLYVLKDIENEEGELLQAIKGQNFAAVAQNYQVIENDSIDVLVPYDPEVFQRLDEEVQQTGLTRKWIDSARPYTIGLYRPRYGARIRDNLDPIPVRRGRELSEQWFIYRGEEDDYDELRGLVPPEMLESLIA